MKFVIQRVKNASCTVDNQIIGEIQQGFCVFIGVSNEDNTEIADKMIKYDKEIKEEKMKKLKT